MRLRLLPATLALLLAVSNLAASPAAPPGETVAGEKLDPATYGPGVIESMAECIARDRSATPLPADKVRKPGEQGVWMVPSRDAAGRAHSGTRTAVNRWGDTRMGIAFGAAADVAGAYFAGQGGQGAWARGVRAIGYRGGVAVQESDVLRDLDPTPRWLAMNFAAVDRIEIVAEPAVGGAGWYSLDDLTFTPAETTNAAATIVLTFEELPYGYRLTGSSYGGLTWETGTGDFSADEGVHSPVRPAGRAALPEVDNPPSPTRAVTPELLGSFQGVIRGDAGSMSFPPDTDGAIGPNHYVITVNRNLAVYDKATGGELMNILLTSFLPGSNGDPRVLFDQHSGRWFIINTDFNAGARIYIAVSLTDDPLGGWFKTNFVTAQGSDAGAWPDYPTLGVDANGIYTSAYMVPGGMTIFAIDKAPLIAPSPSLGTVTAFRQLPWEGAIQPAHTYGAADGEYLVSYASSSSLRLRRVNPPLTSPTLTQVAIIPVAPFSTAPDAPALGSTVPLDTVDERLMMAVWRGGSLWTAHTIAAAGGKAGCRWYQLNTASPSVVQWGTVAAPTMYYYFPSIMVNQLGDAVMGFTGSNSSMYAACYYCGRRAGDPLGEMSEPVQFKAGTGPQNNIDSYGRNRWGDYSYTTLDPSDEHTFYTIQEYGHATDIWGTYVAVLQTTAPDCNGNGIPDSQDIANGTSMDCNLNNTPDECELIDCNGNGVLDECDLAWATSQDCNANATPDECDIAGGVSGDCQGDGVPDECQIALGPISRLEPLDVGPGWTVEGQWAFGPPTGGGSHGGDPAAAHTGANVYGYNLAGDYTNNMPARYLTTRAFNLRGWQQVQLRFWRKLGVEAFDHATIDVSLDGLSWLPVWANPGTINDAGWVQQTVELPAAANQTTVYIRWGLGPTDAGVTYYGWNIDDIELRGQFSASDCDGNAVPDECDLAGGAADCNANGVLDVCDLAAGTSQDANGNGIPDECEGGVLVGDVNCDGQVGFGDINAFVLALSDPAAYATAYPGCPLGNRDVNGNGTFGFDDINPFVTLLTR